MTEGATPAASWPLGVPPLLLMQALERAGHYALVSILVLYLINVRSIALADAYLLAGAFTALAALNSVGGGMVADLVLGRGRSLVAGCLLMAAGGGILAVGGSDVFELALAMIAVGTGLFRPNIPALIGELIDTDDGRRSTAFNFVYMATNLGAMLGPIAIVVADIETGYWAGFLVVGGARLLALIVYFGNRRRFDGKDRPPAKRSAGPMLAVIAAGLAAIAVCALILSNPDIAGWSVAIVCAVVLATYLILMTRQDRSGRGKLIAHLFVVAAAVAFWSIYQQFTLSVIVFTQDDVDRHIGHWLVPASAFNSLNPAFVLLLGPLIVILWRRLRQSTNEPSEFIKLGIGLVFAGVAYEALRLGIYETQAGSLTPFLWLFVFQAFLATGELMVGPVGLTLSNRLSLPGLNGLFTGVWYLSTAIAYYLAGVLAAELTAVVDETARTFTIGFDDFGRIGILAGLIALAIAGRLHRLAPG